MTNLLKPQRPSGDGHLQQHYQHQQQVNSAAALNPRSAKMLSSYQQLEAALKMQINPSAYAGGTGGVAAAAIGKHYAMASPRAVMVAGGGAGGSEISPRAAVKLNPKGGLPAPPSLLPPDEYSSSATLVMHAPKPPGGAAGGGGGGGHSAAASSIMPASSAGSSSALLASPVAAGKEPLTPQAALTRYNSCLTSFERTEILSYPQVYFVGENARKLETNPSGLNNGFDDDKSDYKVVVDDHVGYRYQVLNELGRGSFGQVSKALDHKTKTFVALKIIKNKKKFHDQALIEANILKHLRDNDPNDKMHIVRMVDNFIFRNHMIITFELHGMNLYELCKINKFAPLSIPTIKTFTKQLLVALNFSTMHKIVHCDLKPENILLKQNSKSHIKVIDFGSSCFENQRLYTYIQSRFYRAPEVMLGIPYTPAIDMWSLGCILCELANGYPIFPGETEVDQMACVMEYLGAPPRSLVEKGSRKKLFFDANGVPKIVPNSRGKMRRPGTKELVGFLRSGIVEGDLHFGDFVARCLNWDPTARMTPSQGMQHPWISAMFDEAPNLSARQPAAAAASSATTAVGVASKQCMLPLLPQTARRPGGM